MAHRECRHRPAINVIVGQQADNGGWNAITRYHSLPVKDHAQLMGRIETSKLAVKYSDVTGKWFTTTCFDSESRLYKKDIFRDWTVIFTEENFLSRDDVGSCAIDRIWCPRDDEAALRVSAVQNLVAAWRVLWKWCRNHTGNIDPH